jgi:hypothetical protein
MTATYGVAVIFLDKRGGQGNNSSFILKLVRINRLGEYVLNLSYLGWDSFFAENFKQCRFMFEQAHTWILGVDPFCRYLVPKDKGPPS